jgi:adenosylcobinamide-GDP ribazoletransferase
MIHPRWRLPGRLVRAWQALCLAGRFLTRWPWPAPADAAPTLYGQAAPLFPLIGLLLGALLALLALAAQLLGLTATPAVGAVAILLLLLWVWSTGALHLDGLADCADAWVGGLGSRERTLAILKDPHMGAMGVVALILLLLAKLVGLWALLAVTAGSPPAAAGMPGLPWLLLLLPALARAQILWLALSTPSARPEGLGAVLGAHLPRRAALLAALIATCGGLAGIAAVSMPAAAAAAAAIALVLFVWRRALLERLGGYTGDGIGALVELTETLALLACVLAVSV